jgi:hypothetical protein
MNSRAYRDAVLSAYVALPDTPSSPRSYDRWIATEWFRRGIPLQRVRAALLLGTLRRRCRSPLAQPLAPVISLAYFQPVLEEVLHLNPPLESSYVEYLLAKLPAAPVQIPAVSRER